MHPKFEEFIGDYLAIAISNKGIAYSYKSNRFVSNHAGMTKQEMKIPIITINKKWLYYGINFLLTTLKTNMPFKETTKYKVDNTAITKIYSKLLSHLQ